jgi:hypothetical protein
MSKSQHERDCIRCKVIECFNLFDKSHESVDAGNELYVYSILGRKIDENEDLGVCVCTNGSFLRASCFLADPIFTYYKNSYLSDILIQVTRDFKASIFLAFSGHYRQAMQVLRCGFENIISGAYYHTDLISLGKNNAKTNDFARLNRRFNEWKKGRSRVNVHKAIEVLRRIGFLSMDEEESWNELYNLLSKFIHTPEEFVTRVEHDGKIKLKGEIVCSAATYFSEKQLIEWSDCYQSVFAILLKTVAEFHPEIFNTESGKIAVRCIKSELKYNENKIKVSKEIRQTLLTIHHSKTKR